MHACRVRILKSVLARRRIVCMRGRLVCAFTSVRCIDVSCACAVTSCAQASCVCVHERACALCACCHERACELTSRVRRVRVVTSAMDLRSISGRYINIVLILISINMHILIYN